MEYSIYAEQKLVLLFSKGGNETGVLVLSDDRLTFFAFFFLR